MANVTTRAKALLDGLSNDIPAGTNALQANGQSFVVKTAIATLSAYVTAVEAAASAKVQYRNAVATAAGQRPQVESLLTNLSEALRALFGKGNPVLAQFGVSSGVRKTPSAAVKAAAVGKRQAKLTAKKAALSAAAAPAPTGPVLPAVK